MGAPQLSLGLNKVIRKNERLPPGLLVRISGLLSETSIRLDGATMAVDGEIEHLMACERSKSAAPKASETTERRNREGEPHLQRPLPAKYKKKKKNLFLFFFLNFDIYIFQKHCEANNEEDFRGRCISAINARHNVWAYDPKWCLTRYRCLRSPKKFLSGISSY